jgi:hypothetical protein
MIVLPGAGVPVYQPALKDRSALMAFYDELERWISRGSPAREKDAVLDSEIVLQILKDMSSLVGDISGLGSQMRLWPEPFPQPIEFYHPRTAPRTGASAASVGKDRVQEVTDAIFLVPGNRQAATHRVNAR